MKHKKPQEETSKREDKGSSIQKKWVKKQKTKPYKGKQKKIMSVSFLGKLVKINNNYCIETEKQNQVFKILPKNLDKAKIGDQVIVSKNKFNEYQVIGHSYEESFLEMTQKFYENYIFFKEQFCDEIIEKISNFKEPKIEKNSHRKDLTHEKIITIDPHGARDHDDAISFKKLKSGWILSVHISDVSEYIPANSPLDIEALKRSFTRYLPWKVISMLPKKLSNELCSLQENKLRLALTCSMNLDTEGKLLDFSFFESIIKVKKFYQYEEAWSEHQNKNPYFKDLATLANLIKNQRKHIIEFNFPETKIILNDKGEPYSSKQVERIPSYQWIEDFMLICNQCCAKWMEKNQIPGLYRIHENPEKEDIISLAQQPNIIKNTDKWLKSVNRIPHSKKINHEYRKIYTEILSEIHQFDSKPLISNHIQRQMLRTMKKAIYFEQDLGHFALGFKNYAHFTSPIRRYPDLWNHRFMKQFLKKELKTKKNERSLEDLTHKAQLISQIEIETTKLERNSHKAAIAWILRNRIGDTFKAIITEISEKGFAFFFEDNQVSAEEWIPIFCLTDDYYIFMEQTQILRGKRHHKKFRVGQKIEVFLETVIPAESLLRFRLQ